MLKIFRHGDRAPDPVEMFPKDPYYHDDFFPEGLGGLTTVSFALRKNLNSATLNFRKDMQ